MRGALSIGHALLVAFATGAALALGHAVASYLIERITIDFNTDGDPVELPEDCVCPACRLRREVEARFRSN